MKPLGGGNHPGENIEAYPSFGIGASGTGKTDTIPPLRRRTAHTVSQRLRRIKRIPPELFPLGKPAAIWPPLPPILVRGRRTYAIDKKTQAPSSPSPSALPSTRAPGTCASTRRSASRDKTASRITTTPTARSTARPTARRSTKARRPRTGSGGTGADCVLDLEEEDECRNLYMIKALQTKQVGRNRGVVLPAAWLQDLLPKTCQPLERAFP